MYAIYKYYVYVYVCNVPEGTYNGERIERTEALCYFSIIFLIYILVETEETLLPTLDTRMEDGLFFSQLVGR